MNRRLTVALVATATLGVLAPAASAAPKKNEIRISGGTVFKAGKFMKDEVHFNANTTVTSGCDGQGRQQGLRRCRPAHRVAAEAAPPCPRR